jgi:hypothetical protein
MTPTSSNQGGNSLLAAIDRIAATRSPDMEWLENRIGRMDEINAQEHREAADSPTSGRPHHHGD